MPRQVDHKVKRSRPSWPTWWNPVSTKTTKISHAWWRAPVIPATWEAEAELLEPVWRRLQWAEIAPVHSSLGDKSETLPQKKKKAKAKEGMCIASRRLKVRRCGSSPLSAIPSIFGGLGWATAFPSFPQFPLLIKLGPYTMRWTMNENVLRCIIWGRDV